MIKRINGILKVSGYISLSSVVVFGLLVLVGADTAASSIADGTAQGEQTVSPDNFIDDVPIRSIPVGNPFTVSNSFFEVNLSSDKYLYIKDFQFIFLWATVKNLGSSEDKFDFELTSEVSDDWIFVDRDAGHIRLAPGEEGDLKYMWRTVYNLDLAEEMETDFTFKVTSKETGQSLSFTITVITYPQIEMRGYEGNAIVKGTITDAVTGSAVSEAEVFLWIGQTIRLMPYDMVQVTDSTGIYEQWCWDIDTVNSHYSPHFTVSGFRMVVQKEGYETYVHNEYVKPHNGSPVMLDISLTPLEDPVNFELKWETPLSEPGVWKIAVTDAWDRFAMAMGKHPDPGDPETFPSIISFLDSEGNILWSKSVPDQSWSIDVTRDGLYVACNTHSKGTLNNRYLWDAGGNEIWKKSLGLGLGGDIKFSPDNQYIATGPSEDNVRFVLYDALTGAEKWKDNLDDRFVRITGFTEDGQHVFVGGYPHLFTLNGDRVWHSYITYTPFVICPSSDKSRFMAVDKGDCVSMFDGNGNVLWRKEIRVTTYGAMSADGSVVVVLTTWGSVHCYNGEGEIQWYSYLRGERDYITAGVGGHNAVDITPDGKYIVVGGVNYSTILFDSEGNMLWRHFGPVQSVPWPDGGGHKDSVMAVRISDDGKKIVSGYGFSDPKLCYFERVEDTTAPTVSTTSPTANATEVAVNASISATFSEAMNSSTITTDTFTVSTGGSNIIGSVSYSNRTATFNPSSNLANSTPYTAKITTEAKDKADNAIASEYSWSFATVASGGGGGGGGTGSGDTEGGGNCFIATACFGSVMAEEVQTLSAFRDKYLMTNAIGRMFVRLYYRYSPKLADIIRRREYLKRVVREGLKPLIWIAKQLVN